jgi:copper resistance protein D
VNWFGAEIDAPMIAARTVHFAASAITAGALIFRGFVAEPALRVEPLAKSKFVPRRGSGLPSPWSPG